MNKTFTFAVYLAAVLHILCFGNSAVAETANWKASFRGSLKNGGAYVEDAHGNVLFSHRENDPFVPASTIKIATVAAALHYFGPQHRLSTEFYLSSDRLLFVRGLGDPYLVSEELEKIARIISTKVSQVDGIVLDDSFFADDLKIDGVGSSSNPYDARNGALLANFNTIHITKAADGAVRTAEPQTPLTPTARAFASRLPAGTQRVNLGSSRDVGMRHFAELLSAFLQSSQVRVGPRVELARVPADAQLLYRHESSKTIEEVSRDLLKFSTNFLANQLFLLLGSQAYGPPATAEKGRMALRTFLSREIGWSNFEIQEGAGLSRGNKVTPKQMAELLDYFIPQRHLLPMEQKVLQAKTGSLRGVNTLAGYFEIPNKGTVRFVILINDTVPHTHRFTLANRLHKTLSNEYRK